MLTKLTTASLLALAVAACSADQNETENNTPETTEALTPEIAAIDSALPEAALVRVELDDKGNPVKGTETLRYVSTMSDKSLADSFETDGVRPEAGTNELDADSSTQSWYITRLQQQEGTPAYDQGDQNGYEQPNGGYPQPGQDAGDGYQQPGDIGAGYGQQGPVPGQTYPQPGTQQQAPNSSCINCGTSVEHRQGPSTAAYPVSRKVVYEHRTKDVYPTQYVDIYPIENVRIHPTRNVTRVHPVQRQISYVGNHCQPSQFQFCGYGAQYYPTVSYGGYNQYYHYQSFQTFGRYRYYRYCRPGIFGRFGYGQGGW